MAKMEEKIKKMSKRGEKRKKASKNNYYALTDIL